MWRAGQRIVALCDGAYLVIGETGAIEQRLPVNSRAEGPWFSHRVGDDKLLFSYDAGYTTAEDVLLEGLVPADDDPAVRAIVARATALL